MKKCAKKTTVGRKRGGNSGAETENVFPWEDDQLFLVLWEREGPLMEALFKVKIFVHSTAGLRA